MIWMQKDGMHWDLKPGIIQHILHRGAFMLPKYVEDLLEEEETK